MNSEIRTRTRSPAKGHLFYVHEEEAAGRDGESTLHCFVVYDGVGNELHRTSKRLERNPAYAEAKDWVVMHWEGYVLEALGGDEDWDRDGEMPAVRDHTAEERREFEERAQRILTPRGL